MLGLVIMCKYLASLSAGASDSGAVAAALCLECLGCFHWQQHLNYFVHNQTGSSSFTVPVIFAS